MQQHEATHLQSKVSGWEIMNIVIHSLSLFEEFAGLVISRHRCSPNIDDIHVVATQNWLAMQPEPLHELVAQMYPVPAQGA